MKAHLIFLSFLFPLLLSLSPSLSLSCSAMSHHSFICNLRYLPLLSSRRRLASRVALFRPSMRKSASGSVLRFCRSISRIARFALSPSLHQLARMSASSSTTAVNAASTPSSSKTGYQGSGGTPLRQITSNQLAPTESLIAQAGRDAELRERERHTAGGADAEKGEVGKEGREPKEGEELVVTEGAKGEGEGYAEEWTFPDGGWKAWSVVFVRFPRFHRDRRD